MKLSLWLLQTNTKPESTKHYDLSGTTSVFEKILNADKNMEDEEDAGKSELQISDSEGEEEINSNKQPITYTNASPPMSVLAFMMSYFLDFFLEICSKNSVIAFLVDSVLSTRDRIDLTHLPQLCYKVLIKC